MYEDMMAIYKTLESPYFKLMPNLTSKDLKRFSSKIFKTDSCWFWLDTPTHAGYGLFNIRNVKYSAHRLAYWISNKIDPRELQVQHACNVSPCVNPEHLITGDNTQNIQFAVACGRMPNAKGVNNNASKFTNEEILQIKKLAGVMTQQNIANIFNMTQQEVSLIQNNKICVHIK